MVEKKKDLRYIGYTAAMPVHVQEKGRMEEWKDSGPMEIEAIWKTAQNWEVKASVGKMNNVTDV